MVEDQRIKITPRSRTEVIDNQGLQLKDVWVEMGASHPQKVDHLPEVLGLIDRSVDTICLMAPTISNDAIVAAIKDAASKRDVRIYAIVRDLNDMLKGDLSRSAITRERKGVHDTFMLFDPKGKSPKGVFVPEGSIGESISFPIDLSPEQVEESFAQFCHIFWEASGNEVLDGKLREVQEVKPKRPKVRADLRNAFRSEAFPSMFQRLEEVWAPNGKSVQILTQGKKVGRVVVPFSNAGPLVDVPISADVVEAHDLVPLYHAKCDSGDYVLSDQVCLRLNDGQQKTIRRIEVGSRWSFKKVAKIGEIKGRFCFTDKGKLTPLTVQDKIELEVHPEGDDRPLDAGSFEAWQSSDGVEIREAPKDAPIARRIEYRIRSDPPRLPKGATEHPLVQEWKGAQKYLDDIVHHMQTMKEQIDRAKESVMNALPTNDPTIAQISITFDKLGVELSALDKELAESSISLVGFGHDVSEAQRAKVMIISAVEGFNNALLNGRDELRSSLNAHFDERLRRLSGNQMKKAQKLAKRVTSEIDSWKPVKMGPIEIPKMPLPRIGSLFKSEKGNVNYLAITYVDEIEPAKAEIRKMAALDPILVVNP